MILLRTIQQSLVHTSLLRWIRKRPTTAIRDFNSGTVLKWTRVAATTATVCLCSSCDLRQLPGFKQEAQRQDERITRETQEAIRTSPAFQELNQLCANEIPRPQGFVLKKLARDFKKHTFLSYHYQSDADYHSVKNFYLKYFRDHGWQLSEEKDGGWGPSKIEVRNDRYRIAVYEKEWSGGVYSIICAKL